MPSDLLFLTDELNLKAWKLRYSDPDASRAAALEALSKSEILNYEKGKAYAFLNLAVGLIVGARLGYLLFYQYSQLGYYLSHPLEIIALWHGGMSFHGGLLGALIAGAWFCQRNQLPFWDTADTVIVTAPIGLGLGRIGNFINGELFGRPGSVPWAMVFPSGGPLPRHPSQLYEIALMALILLIFVLLRSPRWRGTKLLWLLALYGLGRAATDLLRGDIDRSGAIGPLTLTQFLCVTAAGVALILLACIWRRTNPARSTSS